MPEVTIKLLRKRAEHNEGMLSTLEEISLHQEELESINDVLGTTCRKLKILYLQNNIISKMENLHHMKDLGYLNLALNNITKIEGLHNCEFLYKLDMTINFVDFDTLEESINHLQSRQQLRDLYLLGNPAQANWPNFNSYVIAKLPQLQNLDGTEITKSMQIKARQLLPALEGELRVLVEQIRRKKAEKGVITSTRSTSTAAAIVEDLDDDGNVIPNDENEQELTENTPEARVKIYQELAQQKKEKEDRANTNAPKERDYEAEQQESIARTRQREAELAEGEVKQKNEGGWEFYWDEDSRPGTITLEVKVSRFLDSSLIDVDVHPTYLSIVTKSKLLRLRLPCEVKAGESRCQRSKTTGSLLVIMPKINPKDTAVTVRIDQKTQQQANKASNAAKNTANKSSNSGIGAGNSRVKVTAKKPSMQELMLLEAQQATAATATTTTSLLDHDIGQGSSNNVVSNLSAIVSRKEKAESVFKLPLAIEETEEDAIAKIMELD